MQHIPFQKLFLYLTINDKLSYLKITKLKFKIKKEYEANVRFFDNPKQKINALKEKVEKAGAKNIFLDWA